jgi:hypothetical protein
MKVFDVPTLEELMQKLKATQVIEKGINNQCKDQLEMNKHGS